MSSIGIDLLVSFDTTGSMYPVISQVRSNVEKFIKGMFKDFDDLRIGVIAHGDYCDAGDPYTIRVMDLTDNESKLCKFVKETERTYGGDADECYELVLNTARTKVNWLAGRKKVFILIGDAAPHGVDYPDNKDKIDWKNEAGLLNDLGVQIFAVHALSYYRRSSKAFYEYIADKTGGVYLTLDDFSEVSELIKATCMFNDSETKLDNYISIIKEKSGITNSLNRNIRRLKGEKVDDSDYYSSRRTYSSPRKATKTGDVVFKESSLIPVLPGRFQVMEVPENIDIRSFVESNGIAFKKGRGFYELTKSETVQQYKEVIMQDRETGEMFTGAQVRERLGLQPQVTSGGVKEKLSSRDTKLFRVFVQSTSVNRKLIGGTAFLYEISDMEDTGSVIADVADTKKVDTKKVDTKKADTKKADTKKVDTKKADTKKADEVEGIKVDIPDIDLPPIEVEKRGKKSTKTSAKTSGKTKKIVTIKNKKKIDTLVSKVSTKLSKINHGDNFEDAMEVINEVKRLIEDFSI